MMPGSTGGEQLQAFEGLVHTTARMFAAQVRREEDDLRQELRIVVWRATRAFDARKTPTRMQMKQYVYGCVANKIKDYKRDAARESARRERNGLTFLYIEDMRLGAHDATALDRRPQQEAFDSRFYFATREEVYGRIDEGKFVLPASVTEREAGVLLMLMMGLSKAEIALRLTITRDEVDAAVAALRQKFADWRPSQRPDSSRTVDLMSLAA